MMMNHAAFIIYKNSAYNKSKARVMDRSKFFFIVDAVFIDLESVFLFKPINIFPAVNNFVTACSTI